MEIRDGIKFEIDDSKFITRKNCIFAYSINTEDYSVMCTNYVNEKYFLDRIKNLKITYYPWKKGDFAIICTFGVYHCVRITTIADDKSGFCYYNGLGGVTGYAYFYQLAPVLTDQDHKLKKDFLEDEKNVLMRISNPDYYKNHSIYSDLVINNLKISDKAWEDKLIREFSKLENLPVVPVSIDSMKYEESTISSIKSRAKKVSYKSSPIKLKR